MKDIDKVVLKYEVKLPTDDGKEGIRVQNTEKLGLKPLSINRIFYFEINKFKKRLKYKEYRY